MTFVSLVRLEGETVVQYASGVGTPAPASDPAEDYRDLALGETRVSTLAINGVAVMP
jgi:hypothetical protein